MDAAARAAGIAEVNDPTADPSKEIPREIQVGPYGSRKSENHSRASLPLSHRRSFSISSKIRPNSGYGNASTYNREGEGRVDRESSQDEERIDTAWDSGHPCWPHENVHQPVDSTLYNSTRLIRIKRDWTITGDLAPTFSTVYPEILEPLMSDGRFRELITHLNEELMRMFDPYSFRAWLDAGLGLATGWLWDDLGLTGVKRDLVKLDKWLEEWNRTHGEPPEFQIIPLRRTAYLNLDIQIPNPQIGPDIEASELDARSANGTNVRAFSVRKPNSSGKLSTKDRSDYAPSSVGRPTDDGAYGAYPVVPPIPGKYLEEAQQNVSRQETPKTPVQASNEQSPIAA